MKKNKNSNFKITISNWFGKREEIDLKNIDLTKHFAMLETLLVYIGEYAKKDWSDSLDEFEKILNKALDEMIEIQKQHKDSTYYFVKEEIDD